MYLFKKKLCYFYRGLAMPDYLSESKLFGLYIFIISNQGIHFWSSGYSSILSKLVLAFYYYTKVSYDYQNILWDLHNMPSKLFLQENPSYYYYYQPYLMCLFTYCGIIIIPTYFFYDSNCYYQSYRMDFSCQHEIIILGLSSVFEKFYYYAGNFIWILLIITAFLYFWLSNRLLLCDRKNIISSYSLVFGIFDTSTTSSL